MKALREFWQRRADAELSLRAWYKIVRQGRFSNLAELKQTFNTVDYVPVNLYVFSLGGNKYRLIAAIHFNAQRVYIRHVLTHQEYDRGDWKP
ncbi:MAG TPA: type II toxin-antitoxin system HigB family toxin [Candidatus Binataceae bacterium]|nr:type II toxin-antitoxin system HigB family toxin [Candidatus Binataceae bacterium]